MYDSLVQQEKYSRYLVLVLLLVAVIILWYSFSGKASDKGLSPTWETASTAVGFFILILVASWTVARMALSATSKPGRENRSVFDLSILLRICIYGFLAALLLVFCLSAFLGWASEHLSKKGGVSVIQHTLQHKMQLSRQSKPTDNNSLLKSKLDCVRKDLSDSGLLNPEDGREKPTTCSKTDSHYFAREFLQHFIPESGGTYLTEPIKKDFLVKFLKEYSNQSSKTGPFITRTVAQEVCLAVWVGSGKDYLNGPLGIQEPFLGCESPLSAVVTKQYLAMPNFSPFTGVSFPSLMQLQTKAGIPERGNRSSAFIYGVDFGQDGPNALDFKASRMEFEKHNDLLESINRGYREILAGHEKAGNLLLGWVQFVIYALFIVGMAQLYLVYRAQKMGDYGVYRTKMTSEEGTMDYISNVRLGFGGYIDASIPRLGFIGTVLGISAALAEAYRIVDPALTPIGQADQIKVVVGLLGIAFNTTFVALVLGVIFDIPFRILVSREVSAAHAVDD